MKLLAGLFLMFVLIAGSLPVMAQATAARIPDHYIVRLGDDMDPSEVAVGHGLQPAFVYHHVFRGFSGFVPPGLLKRLADDPRVQSIEPDQIVEIHAKPGGGGGSTSQVVPKGIERIGAYPSIVMNGTTLDGSGVGVAVLDTGIDLSHRDLAGNVQNGWSAYGSLAQDGNGHGTHVAGIIAALNNTVDVVGVAPKATVYAVKVLSDSGSGSDSAVIGGLDWVKANASSKGIRVVNMSLGRSATADDRSMHLAIQAVINVGVAVVVSAGNDPGVETSDLVPAGFPEVIAVASTTAVNGTVNRTYGYIAADTASYFTTDGAGVAISAPGEDQENLLAGGRISSVGILSLKVGGGTTRMSGTSMSAPHAAGVAALICQKFPLITPTGIGSRLGAGVLETSAPRDWLTSKGYTITSYSFDGMREGILHTTTALLP